MSDSFVARLAALRTGDHAAAQALWRDFYPRVAAAARRKLGEARKRDYDEEDVAVSVFDSLFGGLQAGRFEALADEDDLWRVLLRLTQQKTIDRLRHGRRAKRGGAAVRGESIFTPTDGSAGLAGAADSEAGPEALCALAETLRRMLDRLPPDGLREVAQLRLEGYTAAEIAERLGLSLRSAERKLRLIREAWGTESPS